MALMPVGFISHGAPSNILVPEKRTAWDAWAATLPTPTAILVMSAHWVSHPLDIGAVEPQPLIRDYGGMPPELDEITYDAPGAPALATQVRDIIGAERVRRASARGLDHGAWTPLVALFPQATIPVLQISVPLEWEPADVYAAGQALAPLREEGVFILGSGGVTHNLGALGHDLYPADEFSTDWDEWTKGVLLSGDADALLDYGKDEQLLRLNHPTEEHWRPLIFAAGAASTHGGEVAFPVEGFEYQNLSRRCVQWG